MNDEWQHKAKRLAELVQSLSIAVGLGGAWMMAALSGWAVFWGFVLLCWACQCFDEGRLK